MIKCVLLYDILDSFKKLKYVRNQINLFLKFVSIHKKKNNINEWLFTKTSTLKFILLNIGIQISIYVTIIQVTILGI